MLIQILFYIFVLMVAFYYVTVFLHLLGVKIFEKEDISIGKAILPFYYWRKRKVVK